jgi:hypothetical protein
MLTETDLPEGWLIQTNVCYGGSGRGDEMWGDFLYRWAKQKRFLRKSRWGWKSVLRIGHGALHEAVQYAISTQKMIEKTREARA